MVGHCISFFRISWEGLWGVWYVLSNVSQIILRAVSGPISISMHLRSLTIWWGSNSVLASINLIFCVGVKFRFSISWFNDFFHGAYSRTSLPLNLEVVNFIRPWKALSCCSRIEACCSCGGVDTGEGICSKLWNGIGICV